MTQVIRPKALYMKKSWGLKSQKTTKNFQNKKNTIKIMSVKIALRYNNKF